MTFDTDGGSVVTACRVIDGESLQTTQIPFKAHYSFANWQLNGADYDLNAAVTGDLVLTAVWTPLPDADYIDENGEEQTCGAYTLDNTMTDLTDNWYAVTDHLTVNSRLTVNGDVCLILSDGASLSCQGITVNKGNSLTIYAGKAGSGSLSAVAAEGKSNSGIGSISNYNCGTITIYGGQILAQGYNGGAGIGGAVWQKGGTIRLLGGQISAKTGYVPSGYKKVGIGAGSPREKTTLETELREGTSITIRLKNPDDFITNEASYLGMITLGEDLVTAEGANATAANISSTTISKKSEMVSKWNGLKDRLTESGNLKLDADITQPSGPDTYLKVPEGIKAVLDLNGHSVSSNDEIVQMIRVDGNLTILDSSEDKSGSIKGIGNNSSGIIVGSSGFLYLKSGTLSHLSKAIENKGTFTMTGGTISESIGIGIHNSGKMIMTGGKISESSNSGIVNDKKADLTIGGDAIVEKNQKIGVDNNGSFLMEGGTICLNDSSGVYNVGSFVMTGGSITKNTSSVDYHPAGGVVNSGSFIMNGGSITDNCFKNPNIPQYVQSGGVYNKSDASMSVGGNARITGNYALDADNEKINKNVLLQDQHLVISTSLSGAKIGVSYSDEWYSSDFYFKIMTAGLKENGTKDCFVSDLSDFAIAADDDGEAVITRKITVHFQDEDRKALKNQPDEEALYGVDYILPECYEEFSEATEFDSWKISDQNYAPGKAVRFYNPIPIVILGTKAKACIQFFASTETAASDRQVYVSQGKQYTLPVCPYTAPSGMEFSGWRLDNDTQTLYQPGDAIVTNDPSYYLYAIWKDVPHTVAAYSRTKADSSSIADIAVSPNGSSFLPDTEITLTAPDLNSDGYRFVGWYPVTETSGAEVTGYDTANPCTTKRVYRFKMGRSDTAFTAVYEPYANAIIKVKGLDGAKYHTMADPADRTEGTETVTLGKTLTLVAQQDDVFQWQNGCGKVLGTGQTLDITVVGNMEITLLYRSQENTKSYIQFESDCGQVLAGGLYGAEDTITFPAVPVKYGYEFLHWTFEDDADTEADEAAIKAKIPTNSRLILRPVYQKDTGKGSIFVEDISDSGVSLGSSNAFNDYEIGTTFTLHAKEYTGYRFAYWTRQEHNADPDKEPEIVGYDTALFVQVREETVYYYAVYVPVTEEAEEPIPLIRMESITASVNDGTNYLTGTSTRNVPSGYTMIEQGMLYTLNDYTDQPDSFVAGADGVYLYQASDKALNGILHLHVKIPEHRKKAVVSFRAYMILKNTETGNCNYYYSDSLSDSFYHLNTLFFPVEYVCGQTTLLEKENKEVAFNDYQSFQMEAPQIDGYRFAYWSFIAKNSNNNLSKEYLMSVNSSFMPAFLDISSSTVSASSEEAYCIRANYVKENTCELSVFQSEYQEYTDPDNPYVNEFKPCLEMFVTWDLPENDTVDQIIEKGILCSETALSEASFEKGTEGVNELEQIRTRIKIPVTDEPDEEEYEEFWRDEIYLTAQPPVWYPTIKAPTDEEKELSYRAYITFKDPVTEETRTYYSNIIRGAFKTFNYEKILGL